MKTALERSTFSHERVGGTLWPPQAAGGRFLWLLLGVVLSSCGKPSYSDPKANWIPSIQTNVIGKWECLWCRYEPRLGSEAIDPFLPSHRWKWTPGCIGKGFEFCSNGTVKVYSFTNTTVPRGAGVSSFNLTATGHYTMTGGALQVQLNGENVSSPFPSKQRTDYVYAKLPRREQAWADTGIYLALTNEALGGAQIPLFKVSKFKFE
jgi:hypothetical protein